jgi:hypothetical protein
MKVAISPRFVVFCLICLAMTRSASAQQLEWARQLGTSVQDYSASIAADSLGNVYIGGAMNGDGGALDAAAFLSRYDAAGNLQWTKEFGTDKFDQVHSISLDPSGNILVAGFTLGSLGGPHVTNRDAFLSKFDAAGNQLWARQFGTTGIDEFNDVATDSLGNVYVSGYTGSIFLFDGFLRKYDAAGSLLWDRQVATAGDDFGSGVTVDPADNVYLSGATQGSLDGPNAGYNATGDVQWTRQFGTAGIENGSDVSTDSLGNVYVVGYTEGDLGGPNAGSYDTFVRKYDSAGSLQWTRQLGTSADDSGVDISVDTLGGVYIAGYSRGGLDGPNAGETDAFLSKYDAAGNLHWTRQLGTTAADEGFGVSADSLGSVYISGLTRGDLGGSNAGLQDAFLAKYSVPEPGTLLMGLFACVALAVRRRNFAHRA